MTALEIVIGRAPPPLKYKIVCRLRDTNADPNIPLGSAAWTVLERLVLGGGLEMATNCRI
jgi:hypothetical protein